ncbi:glycosyltransferase family 61 protein, partial [Bradyrhizobium sp. P5_C11_2]
ITESLWHSEVHFSKFARCDRTTNWRYRVAGDYDAVSIKGTIANAYHRYSYQYFHWFFDSMPRIWALKKYLKDEEILWFAGALNQGFHRPSLELLDLDFSRFLRFEGSAVIQFERAYNAAFRFTENINTLRPDFNSGTYNAGWADDYVADLRDRAVAKVRDLSPATNSERIYVARPDTTHRKVVNEDEVLRLLGQHGFECIAPGTKTFFEQIAIFRKAKFVIGPHGAGFTNLLWSNPGTVVLEFMPGSLSDVGYRFLSNFAGHRHNVLLCDELAHPMGNAYANMEVDIDALRAALKELDV